MAFIHVPKCGGMSVDAALRAAIRTPARDGWIEPGISRDEARLAVGEGVPERAIPRMLAHRSYLLFHFLSEGHPVVSGHGPVTPWILERFADRTPFVTVLRDPVERWISYYVSNRLASEDPNIVPNRFSPLAPQEELEAVLASADAGYIGSFFATYLGGHRPYGGHDPRDAIEPAVDALRRFAVIGFTSYWADFAEQCDRRLGLEVTIPRLNATERYATEEARSPFESLFTTDVRRRIASLCDADVQIYREARRIRGMPEDSAS